jgi:hypothetical protein
VGEAITAENYRTALRAQDWELYAIELGDPDSEFTQVQGLDRYAPYGDSFSTVVAGRSTPFVTLVDADFASGGYFDMTEGTTAAAALQFPGFPGRATEVR